jgi:hypothetical protein
VWQIKLVELVRALLLDYNEPPKYSDERLQRLIVSSAWMVIQQTGITPYVADLAALTITPDPTVTSEDSGIEYLNKSLTNLTALKAACLMDNGEARRAAGQALDISDSGSRISIRGIAAARLAILKEGWCKHYSDALFAYLFSGTGAIPGMAVLSPFRVCSTDSAYAFMDDNPNEVRYGSVIQGNYWRAN